ncbi:MAG: heat-inducible transcriptional repressor HrcA [Victivallaceae bacterium]
MIKKTQKEAKFSKIILNLVELYLDSGTPIGSGTLKREKQDKISSATIRNYCVELEKTGFLKKNHASGGRLPTDKALRFYFDYYQKLQEPLSKNEKDLIADSLPACNKNIIKDIQKSGELLSELLNLSVFFSFPRFDHDTATDLKLLVLDEQRVLVVILTEFGQIFTETIWVKQKMSAFSAKRVESFIKSKLKNQSFPESLTSEEQFLGQDIYNESIVRYLTRYVNLTDMDIHQTGFSKLLHYNEFKDPEMLSSGLMLFENSLHMKKLLLYGMTCKQPTAFLGKELSRFFDIGLYEKHTVVMMPYFINRTPLGAFGILGPSRIPYRKILKLVTFFGEKLRSNLTESLFKFKLSFRQPKTVLEELQDMERMFLDHSSIKLLPSKES